MTGLVAASSSESCIGKGLSSPTPPEFFPLNRLPSELIHRILNNPVLSDIEQARVREVCKLWSCLVKPVSDPQVTVYGKKAWETYFGYQIKGEIPPPPPRILEEVEFLRGQLKGEQEPPKCMLVLIPKGLTFRTLMRLVAFTAKRYIANITIVGDRVVKEYIDRKLTCSRWVLITDGVIEGSRNKNYFSLKSFVASEINSKYGFHEVIVAVACVALKYVKTGESMLCKGDKLWTGCDASGVELPLVLSFSRFGFSADYPTSHYGSNVGVAVGRIF